VLEYIFMVVRIYIYGRISNVYGVVDYRVIPKIMRRDLGFHV